MCGRCVLAFFFCFLFTRNCSTTNSCTCGCWVSKIFSVIVSETVSDTVSDIVSDTTSVSVAPETASASGKSVSVTDGTASGSGETSTVSGIAAGDGLISSITSLTSVVQSSFLVFMQHENSFFYKSISTVAACLLTAFFLLLFRKTVNCFFVNRTRTNGFNDMIQCHDDLIRLTFNISAINKTFWMISTEYSVFFF